MDQDQLTLRLRSKTESKLRIVLGPPGTGKTTTLLNLVLMEMERGVPPDRIAYLAFTRKASMEAVDRAIAKFSLNKKDFPLFRTLHSLAYRQLGISRDQVFLGVHLRQFAELMKIEVKGYVDMSEGEITFAMSCKGDRMMFMENLARVRQIPLAQQFSEGMEDFGYMEVERIERGLVEFKKERGVLDYTDMITEFVARGECPKIEVLFVDEAQDLSAIQWRMVEKLASSAQRVYIAGDDDQAIFRWAGADVGHFITIQGEVEVLSQSYRVPRSIQAIAGDVLHRIQDRRIKEWAPREADGEVLIQGDSEGVDLGEGTWLVLARNDYLLEQITGRCYREGIFYERRGKSPVKVSQLQAIRSWERLRRGKEVTIDTARAIYELMSSGKGVKRGHKKIDGLPGRALVTMEQLKVRHGLMVDTPWFDALDKFGDADREYVRSVLRRKEKISDVPRVKIGTIHSAKGGEADNVMLITDMAPRTYFEWRRHPGDEERVFYVGVTRAKEKLFLVLPQTKIYFPLASL